MSATLSRRLSKIERARGFRGDLERATDAELEALIREGYRQLEAEHGSLSAAANHLSRSADAGERALATLIREDIEARAA